MLLMVCVLLLLLVVLLLLLLVVLLLLLLIVLLLLLVVLLLLPSPDAAQQPHQAGCKVVRKRTKAEPGAAEPTQPPKGKGKAAKAKPAPQPGRWLDRDCNAALNMQRIGESRWRPLELCFWPDQGALPAKGKEYPGLGYKRLRDKPPKAQEQQPPAVAQ
ncbi:hypothetical protein QJQ45_022258 [Haematococcus lacustris]|nr:hypothetical protein QJQ45_022258 [Haematococcus lacustris]